MASKTINIDAEVYDTLKALKRDMSFTEYIKFLLTLVENPPKSSFGVLSDEDISYDEIKENRDDRNVTI